MIEVRLTPLLAKRAKSRREEFSLPFNLGMTPGDVGRSEGFHGAELEALLPIVNGAQADLEVALHDGDRLEMQIGIAGG
jgi:hypothetical protein